MAKHEEKMAKIKVGPGSFSYSGGAMDTEWVPAKLGERGEVVKPGELKKSEVAVYKIGGLDFPKGKPVEVSDEELALKLRTLGCFVEQGAAKSTKLDKL